MSRTFQLLWNNSAKSDYLLNVVGFFCEHLLDLFGPFVDLISNLWNLLFFVFFWPLLTFVDPFWTIFDLFYTIFAIFCRIWLKIFKAFFIVKQFSKNWQPLIIWKVCSIICSRENALKNYSQNRTQWPIKWVGFHSTQNECQETKYLKVSYCASNVALCLEKNREWQKTKEKL